MHDAARHDRDPLATTLEAGLILVLVVSPLLFGSARPSGRLFLESASLLIALLWLLRSVRFSTPLPPRIACSGLIGLMLLALLQLAPLGTQAVAFFSPNVTEIDLATKPPQAVLMAEQSLIGVDPSTLSPSLTLSLDPSATASALRTGAALGLLFVVATTVAAVRGVGRLALALLIGASFQGLYGLLVLVSGHNKIWHLPKEHYLNAATGTFVNKNHFACYLAMALACGAALIIHNYRGAIDRTVRWWLVRILHGYNSRNLLLLLLLTIGIAGLLLSYSRAGIALGVAALILTVLVAGRFETLSLRLVTILCIVSVAVVPLLQVGSDRLVARYLRSSDEIAVEGRRGTVWIDTLHMANAYPVFGAGFGTFAAVYPQYRSPEVRQFYKHAHNDLLQAVAEGGLIGLVFLLLLLGPVLVAMARGLAGMKGTLGIGVAAALAAFLLHSLVDFNAHIPANAATAAVLAGALCGLPCKRTD